MPLLQSLPILTAGTFLLVLAAVYLIAMPSGDAAAATRVAEYTAYGLPSSPGLAAQNRSVSERTVSPLLQGLFELLARSTPERVQKATARDLLMAGSDMSPTVFLGVRGLVMFG